MAEQAPSWLGQLPLTARAAGAGLLLFALSACTPPAEQVPTYLAPDCTQPFEAQVAAITAQPHLVPAGIVGSEPYSYYSSADGRTSYLITRPGSPAHPAIMMQTARGGVATTGCAYGTACRQPSIYLPDV